MKTSLLIANVNCLMHLNAVRRRAVDSASDF